ncbi:MAG: glyoxalase [Pseudomonadota bacterium]
MDYQTVEPEEFGASLQGIGLNLLVRDVPAEVSFLQNVFKMSVFQPSEDFAIMSYGDALFQLHSDGTYHSNPLLSLVPEAGARGGGAEIRLYDSDPDIAAKRAEDYGATILQAPSDKPHGLREAYILCDNGYAWVASRPL